MFPSTGFSGGQYYNMPQQGSGFQGGVPSMNFSYPQQSSGFLQAQSSGTGNTGSIDVNQLVAAIFQPVVDLLNTSLSGTSNTGQSSVGTGGSQLPTESISSGQFLGSQYTGSQFPSGQYSGYPQSSGSFGVGQGMDESTQALQLLNQNADALALFDGDEDGNLNRSELLNFAKSQEAGMSPNAQAAATWLASDDGKKAFDALDGYGGAQKDQKFDLKALPIVASDPALATTETGINNGQDALYALNDEDFINSVSRTAEGSKKPVIDFSKLEEVAKSEGDTYTDLQKEAATFILGHDELKKKLGGDNDGSFFADQIGEVLNNDPSISKIAA